jgi:uncharacterized lipoprotein YddW (UPF0748 family)
MDKETLFKPKGEVLKFLDALKGANFNAVYVNTQFRGEVLYPDSAYLPQAPEVKGKDILKWLLPEIHKRRMRAEAWTEYGFYAYHTPDATTTTTRGAILDGFPELTSIDSKGNKYLHHEQWGDFYVLCPVNPKSQEILVNLFAEMIQRYEFDGINLDRIRFARRNYCFCDYCRKKFREDTGVDLKCVDVDTELKWFYFGYEPFWFGDYDKFRKDYWTFMGWREKNLTDFMRRLSERLRGIRKGLAITSAVASPDQHTDYGQDFPTWLEKGYLDAAMPMLYSKDITFGVMRTRRITRRGDRIFHGLDGDGNTSDVLVRQIKQVRAKQPSGITIWYSGAVEDDLPMLRETVFKEPAAPHFPILFGKHEESAE